MAETPETAPDDRKRTRQNGVERYLEAFEFVSLGLAGSALRGLAVGAGLVALLMLFDVPIGPMAENPEIVVLLLSLPATAVFRYFEERPSKAQRKLAQLQRLQARGRDDRAREESAIYAARAAGDELEGDDGDPDEEQTRSADALREALLGSAATNKAQQASSSPSQPAAANSSRSDGQQSQGTRRPRSRKRKRRR